MQFINFNHEFHSHLFFMTRVKKIIKFEIKIKRIDLVFFFYKFHQPRKNFACAEKITHEIYKFPVGRENAIY